MSSLQQVIWSSKCRCTEKGMDIGSAGSTYFVSMGNEHTVALTYM